MYNRYRLSDNFCWIIRSARRLFCSASCDLARGNPCPTAGEHNEIAISQRQREHGVAVALVVTVVVAVAAADGDKWATNHVKSERHCWQNNFSVSVRIWEQCRLPAWLVPWLTRWLAGWLGRNVLLPLPGLGGAVEPGCEVTLDLRIRRLAEVFACNLRGWSSLCLLAEIYCSCLVKRLDIVAPRACGYTPALMAIISALLSGWLLFIFSSY